MDLCFSSIGDFWPSACLHLQHGHSLGLLLVHMQIKQYLGTRNYFKMVTRLPILRKTQKERVIYSIFILKLRRSLSPSTKDSSGSLGADSITGSVCASPSNTYGNTDIVTLHSLRQKHRIAHLRGQGSRSPALGILPPGILEIDYQDHTTKGNRPSCLKNSKTEGLILPLLLLLIHTLICPIKANGFNCRIRWYST